jgi:hypothetical protein
MAVITQNLGCDGAFGVMVFVTETTREIYELENLEMRQGISTWKHVKLLGNTLGLGTMDRKKIALRTSLPVA